MKKVLLVCTLIATLSFGSEVATKGDIKDLIHHMDKRFEQVDKRFEQMQISMDKRFEQVDKRFEQVDKRFEDIMNFLFLLASGVFALMGFVMWDRRTMITQTKKEISEDVEYKLDDKVDKNVVKHIVEALRELGKKDKEFNEILSRHHLNIN